MLRVLAVGVAALTAALALVATFREDAHAQSPQTIAVSVSGSDGSCVRGDVSRPCASFGRAYGLALCGDVIEVGGGSYPEQVVFERASLSACSSDVVFRPAAGASVSAASIALGSGCCGPTDGPDHVRFESFRVPGSISSWADSEYVTFDRIDGGSFYLDGKARFWTIRNSDFGPCDSSGGTGCSSGQGQNFIAGTDVSDVVFENNSVHDYRIVPGSGDHFECLWTSGGTNVTIRGNRFWNCETNAIALGPQARLNSRYVNWVIENNWFGRTCCFGANERNTAVNLGGDLPYGQGSVLIRFNSFAAGQGVVAETNSDRRGVKVIGNILTSAGCLEGVIFSGNLFDQGACSASDRRTAFGYVFDGTRLRVDSPRAKAVQLAFALTAEGDRPRETARLLMRRHLPAPPGGWTWLTVRRLVVDNLYLGRSIGVQREHAPLVSIRRYRAAAALFTRSAGRRAMVARTTGTAR